MKKCKQDQPAHAARKEAEMWQIYNCAVFCDAVGVTIGLFISD